MIAARDSDLNLIAVVLFGREGSLLHLRLYEASVIFFNQYYSVMQHSPLASAPTRISSHEPLHLDSAFPSLFISTGVIGIILIIILLASQRSRQIVIFLLKLGPIPSHIAFIMDGNRRFAKQKGSGSVIIGHKQGFQALRDTLEWCLDLGVQCVTVYAFSIENFNRDKQEVDDLMDLAVEKFNEFSRHSGWIQERGVRVCVIGELDMLPDRVKKAALEVNSSTRHHCNAILNIAFAYTSTAEIYQAKSVINNGIAKGDIAEQEVSPELVDQLMYTAGCPDLDMLIRTSGQVRLSDFMLWQASKDCKVYFLECLWPEFGFWTAVPVLLEWQATWKPRRRKNNTQVAKSLMKLKK